MSDPIPTPIADMPTAQILELAEMLQSEAYQNLSRLHSEYLAELNRELRIRKH